MSTVTFFDTWLNAAADPSDCIGLPTSTIEHDPAVVVDTRQYVGGWFPVTTPGRQRSAKITLPLGATLAPQVAWLKTHQGQQVCYRDATGEKWYGNYTDPTFAPNRARTSDGQFYWDVSFSVQETYFSELQ